MGAEMRDALSKKTIFSSVPKIIFILLEKYQLFEAILKITMRRVNLFMGTELNDDNNKKILVFFDKRKIFT